MQNEMRKGRCCRQHEGFKIWSLGESERKGERGRESARDTGEVPPVLTHKPFSLLPPPVAVSEGACRSETHC